MNFFYGILSFCCLALIPPNFAKFTSINPPLVNEEFAVPSADQNKEASKLYKKVLDQIGGNGKDESIVIMIGDLIEQDNVIGAVLDNKTDQAQQIKPFLMEQYNLLKSVASRDKTMAPSLQNLRNAIGTMKNAIFEGKTIANSKFNELKTVLQQSLLSLADRMQIPQNEIIQEKGEKFRQEKLLMELAKSWAEYKRQNGKKSHEKGKNNEKDRKNEKRIVQLLYNLLNDGTNGLASADLKSGAKNRQRRRKGRGIITERHIVIFCVIGIIICIFNISLFCYCQCCDHRSAADDIEASNSQTTEETDHQVITVQPVNGPRPLIGQHEPHRTGGPSAAEVPVFEDPLGNAEDKKGKKISEKATVENETEENGYEKGCSCPPYYGPIYKVK
ncbi:hypothetical protein niasHT_005091 [Heterodera trifolii]|uniref:Uncharacterized protein n=1 Tax=Heterodera trifolii TaxID=157864 RepID=A0ABD2MET3_9BILA